MEGDKPKVAVLVRHLMPDASEEELIEATENLRRFLGVAYDIFLRREKDGTLDAFLAEAADKEE